MLEFCTHILNTDLVLKTEQKKQKTFLGRFILLYMHCIQVCVGYQNAKNYLPELRLFLIDG